jgi:hypothetical protein
MNRPLSLALLVLGVILLAFGFNAAESLASETKEFFTGNPTDRSIWLIVLGAIALVLGLGGLARGASRRA